MNPVWGDGFYAITETQARWVRGLRVEGEYTWRAIASACAKAWNGDWDSNQLAGMDICQRAALVLEEDYMKEPWN